MLSGDCKIACLSKGGALIPFIREKDLADRALSLLVISMHLRSCLSHETIEKNRNY